MSETQHKILLGLKLKLQYTAPLQLLTSHSTPHTLSCVQTVPLVYQKKLNWYHGKMDALVDNNTQDLHWPLSSSESRHLLDTIFLDHVLFLHTSKCSSMSHLVKKWHANGATVPLKSSDANQKPDLILLLSSVVDLSRELDWRDIIIFREMKNKKTADSLRNISTAPIETIGFDETVFWDCDKKRKKVLVAWKGSSCEDDRGNSVVSLEQLIFISDTLHGHGTTIWSSAMKDPTSLMIQRQVVIKDCWIDPLWKFMEGNSSCNQAVISTIFAYSSHLLMELLGVQVMAFSSLTQLLIAFLDYVQIHKDAIVKVKVLHHDISLLNLLLILWDASQDDSCCLDFLNQLLPETHEHLQAKIQELPYQGFLVDWGYAVPLDVPQAEVYTKYTLLLSPRIPPHYLLLLIS
ncbi:hypothetical protein EDC04DRAFT_2605729 [Pisolithus marmoratus]|nr:hypothetical protein EDC04DRAFT_2605729 [Pisolithus marmoratus]